MSYDLRFSISIEKDEKYSSLIGSSELVSSHQNTYKCIVKNIGKTFLGGKITEIKHTIPIGNSDITTALTTTINIPHLEKGKTHNFSFKFLPIYLGVVKTTFKVLVDGEEKIKYYRNTEKKELTSGEFYIVLPIRDCSLLEIIILLKKIAKLGS